MLQCGIRKFIMLFIIKTYQCLHYFVLKNGFLDKLSQITLSPMWVMCCYILKQIMCNGEEGVESHRGKLSHPSFPAKERAGTSKFWCKNISVASIQINILIDFFSQGHWLSDTTLTFCQADLGYIVTTVTKCLSLRHHTLIWLYQFILTHWC